MYWRLSRFPEFRTAPCLLAGVVPPTTRRIRKAARRVGLRPEGRHTDLDKWWDRVYAEHSPFTGAGNKALTEEENERDFLVRWDVLNQAIQKYRRPSHSRVLDAGCGNGVFTKKLVELGFDVTAFDFSREAVESAKRLVGYAPHWEVAAVESFKSSRAFDFVMCIGVLMCVVRDEVHARAVRNLASLVAGGGYLVIEELLVPLAEMGPEPPPGRSGRLRAIEVYEDLLGRAGFELLEHVHFHIPSSNQDKSLLVYARRPSAGVGNRSAPAAA